MLLYQSLIRYWRRRKYQRLDGTGKRNVRVVRLGGNNRRLWKVRAIPRLRIPFPSPFKILARIRDAYVNAMLGLVGKAGSLHSTTDASFGAQRVSKVRVRAGSKEDFESRLVLEICKAIVASRELAAV